LNRGLSVVALLLAISMLPAASIYAWQMTQVRPETPLFEFRVLVNGQREIILYVPVNLDDGLTREDCEIIAERAFKEIMGDVMHSLDEVNVDGSKMDASYTWGINESDMGHFFNISGDVASHTFTVTHCK
jgi:hypothetical protein